jgi:UDPglucose 6-dehydrogenase
MKITIHGTGFVGLPMAAVLAEVGNDVMCVDVDKKKINMLQRGKVPIYEPGLEELVEEGIVSNRLQFTSSPKKGVEFGEVQFIAVGTPPDEDGSADLKYVLAVARSIGEYMKEYRVVVDKSTVPVGTADLVKAEIRKVLKKRKKDIPFDVVSNPEFMAEGKAVEDFQRPDRIIIGSDSQRALELLKKVYAPFTRTRSRLIEMDVRSAELTKYASNAMLATRISFMNDLSRLAEKLGADIEDVRLGMGADPRIGYSFIYPGCGYGGSCFPKDVKALICTASEHKTDLKLLKSVEEVNKNQKTVLFQKVKKHFGEKLEGKTIAIWGLAFKPDTDDMREASSRVLLEALWKAGVKVQAYDPQAKEEAKRIYGKRKDFKFCDNMYEALNKADALAIVTEWKEFRSPDFKRMHTLLKNPLIFDGRNMYTLELMKQQGFTYHTIGRPVVK